MQTSKKNNANSNDPNRIAKVAEILGLKEGTKITWEGKNLKAFDAYKFEW